MESRFDWFRNAFGVVLGLIVGLITLSPVALKAIDMLPVLSILTPAQDQEVAGAVTFYATADSEGVASLQFQVDGQDFGSPITAGSCRATWNSTEAVDGLHTVQAIGRDEFNNPISSAAGDGPSQQFCSDTDTDADPNADANTHANPDTDTHATPDADPDANAATLYPDARECRRHPVAVTERHCLGNGAGLRVGAGTDLVGMGAPPDHVGCEG